MLCLWSGAPSAELPSNPSLPAASRTGDLAACLPTGGGESPRRLPREPVPRLVALTVLGPNLLPGCPLPALPCGPMCLSAGLCPRTSEEEEEEVGGRYLGQGGVAAVQVEVLAAVEGDGEGAAEAGHGGGLWEGWGGIRAEHRPKDPLAPAPPPLKGGSGGGWVPAGASQPAWVLQPRVPLPLLGGKFSHKEPMRTALLISNTSWLSFTCKCVNIGLFKITQEMQEDLT